MAQPQAATEEAQPVTARSIADLFNDLPFRHYPQKHMIVYQGDKLDRIYYIISGYVRMYNITSKGNERTLSILGPGESIPLIQAETANYFYDAFTDVDAAYCSYEEVVRRFLADGEYMEVARRSGVKIMQRMMEHMDMLANDTAIEKMEAAFRFLAKYYGEENEGSSTLKFKMTHQELGNFVNLTRETVSNLIHKLEKRKLIKINAGGYITVLTEPEENKVAPADRKLAEKWGGVRLRAITD